ncbi:MAG: hypothetical protein IT436_10925 [Phycisphaerales bacterium]|nr:hypothetical protein [Phycisphaerales bacterium]
MTTSPRLNPGPRGPGAYNAVRYGGDSPAGPGGPMKVLSFWRESWPAF